jgi:hypothetical protein
MCGSRFRHLDSFRMSFWNKKIGCEDSVFGDQKACWTSLHVSNAQLSRVFTNFR